MIAWLIYILSIKEKCLENSKMPLPKIVTPVYFLGFLVILPLYFLLLFFCCPRHVSRCMCSFEHMPLPDWQISTPHLISLNNQNSLLSPWIFSTLLSFPQFSLSLPQSSPRYSLFLNFLLFFYLLSFYFWRSLLWFE